MNGNSQPTVQHLECEDAVFQWHVQDDTICPHYVKKNCFSFSFTVPFMSAVIFCPYSLKGESRDFRVVPAATVWWKILLPSWYFCCIFLGILFAIDQGIKWFKLPPSFYPFCSCSTSISTLLSLIWICSLIPGITWVVGKLSQLLAHAHNFPVAMVIHHNRCTEVPKLWAEIMSAAQHSIEHRKMFKKIFFKKNSRRCEKRAFCACHFRNDLKHFLNKKCWDLSDYLNYEKKELCGNREAWSKTRSNNFTFIYKVPNRNKYNLIAL